MTTKETTPPNVNLQHEYVARLAWKQGVLGALNLASQVLAVRLILLLSVVGAICLAWVSLTSPDPFRLAAVGLYTLTVVAPLVWLAGKR